MDGGSLFYLKLVQLFYLVAAVGLGSDLKKIKTAALGLGPNSCVSIICITCDWAQRLNRNEFRVAWARPLMIA